jgi:hypothetical protein
MKIEELRKELDETTRIFLSAKYYELDFRYVHSVRTTFPIVYSTFYFFIERVFYAVTVALILDLSKLFDRREKFSLGKLCNKMLDNYEKSELNSHLTKSELETLFVFIEKGEIDNLLEKLKSTRDKYYAHLDRNRPSFSEIQINSSETGKLISIVENLLKTIELKYFGVSVDYGLTIGELGHNIFERLDEWEKYRETYGYIRED